MSDSENTTFETQVRVYIEDTDAGGIVYYVNYLKFMERGRSELLRELGFGKAAMFDDDAMFVVRSVNTQYAKPAELDDLLRVETQVSKLKKASAIMAQSVYRGEERLVHGEVGIACVSRSTRKPIAIPAKMYQAMARYVIT